MDKASAPKDVHVSPIPCVKEMEEPIDNACNQAESLQQGSDFTNLQRNVDDVSRDRLSSSLYINLDEVCDTDSNDSGLMEWLLKPIPEKLLHASPPKDVRVSPIPCVKEMEEPIDKAGNRSSDMSNTNLDEIDNASGDRLPTTAFINVDEVCNVDSNDSGLMEWLLKPIPEEEFVRASAPKDIHVSPIPCEKEMGEPIDKAGYQADSLQQISSPVNTPNTKLPFYSCCESPIEIRHAAASTPFRGQILSSSSSLPSEQVKDAAVKIGKANNFTFIAGGNDTFTLSTKPTTENEVMDCTWSVGNRNDTYTKEQNDSISSKRLTFCKPANTTFDVEITKNGDNVTLDVDHNRVNMDSGFNIGHAPDSNKKLLVSSRLVEENENVILCDTAQNLSKSSMNASKSDITKVNHCLHHMAFVGTEHNSGSDIMESCATLESSAESSEGSLHRKPLASLPQPTNSRLKPTMKRPSSRLAAPRMNTAAMSRIQARSPNKQSDATSKTANSGGKFSGNSQKPTASRSLPSSASNASRPNNARKSFLPPPFSTKSKKPAVPATDIENSKAAANKDLTKECSKTDRSNTRAESSELTPTKRKAQESPKRIGRSAKFSGNRTESSVSSRLSLATSRSTSANTSRIASGLSRTSRLQRSTGLKAPTSSSRFSTLPSTSVKLSNGVGRASSSSTTKTAAKSDHIHCSPTKSVHKHASSSLTFAGNLRNDKVQISADKAKSDNCATALAILLDYVVNKLDGLSAPRLQGENQQLEKLLQDKKELSESLSVKLADFELSLHASKEAHQRDVNELTESHERAVETLKKDHENIVTQLSSELEKEREEYRQQKVQFQLQQDAKKSAHEEAVSRMRSEWENEQEKLLAELKEISGNMETRIQEEVEERIQPYINARAEVESLAVVLEMKNDEIHKLHNQTSQQTMQREQIRNLQNKVEQLSQKNEDLSMQLQDKVDENRNTAVECKRLRHSVEEEQNRSMKLRQQNDELVYQLNSASPSPSSSFNPVFTPSPTVSSSPQMFSASLDSTPINAMIRRSNYLKSTPNTDATSSNGGFPRSLSYANDNNEN